eukprot:scaffold86261_cov40-Tisochrysis_lutea.AAC.2
MSRLFSSRSPPPPLLQYALAYDSTRRQGGASLRPLRPLVISFLQPSIYIHLPVISLHHCLRLFICPFVPLSIPTHVPTAVPPSLGSPLTSMLSLRFSSVLFSLSRTPPLPDACELYLAHAP